MHLDTTLDTEPPQPSIELPVSPDKNLLDIEGRGPWARNFLKTSLRP